MEYETEFVFGIEEHSVSINKYLRNTVPVKTFVPKLWAAKIANNQQIASLKTL